MDKNIYFKCYRCGYIFYKKNKEFVKNKKIQNELKKLYTIDYSYCKSCIEYENWEKKHSF